MDPSKILDKEAHDKFTAATWIANTTVGLDFWAQPKKRERARFAEVIHAAVGELDRD